VVEKLKGYHRQRGKRHIEESPHRRKEPQKGGLLGSRINSIGKRKNDGERGESAYRVRGTFRPLVGKGGDLLRRSRKWREKFTLRKTTSLAGRGLKVDEQCQEKEREIPNL